jgi:hypothetical protein
MPFYRNGRAGSGGGGGLGTYSGELKSTQQVINASDYGYEGFSSFNISRQNHTDTYTHPSSVVFKTEIDLGNNHNYRYVDVTPNPNFDLTSETLWTNSSPSSNYSSGDISISDRINYDWIEIHFAESTTNTRNTKAVRISYRENTITSDNYCPRHAICAYDSESSSSYKGCWARFITAYDTKINISTCRKFIQGEKTSTVNTKLIPTEVIGYKKDFSSRYDVLWTNSSPSSSFAAQTVNLNNNYRYYYFITFIFRATTSSSSYGYFTYSSTDVYYFDTNNGNLIGVLSTNGATDVSWGRRRYIYYTGTTSIGFSDCINLPASDKAAVSNGSCIPIAIIGHNMFIDPRRFTY